MGRDSVWIVTDSITSVLDSGDPSFVTSMEGAIGTRAYYSEETSSFMDFKAQFREFMKSDYPEEDHLVPGVDALRAYDSVKAISQAVTRLGSDEKTNSETLLKEILSSDFRGLSGDVKFRDGSLLDSSYLKIINIVGKSYKELGFWTSEHGFLKNDSRVDNSTPSMKKLDSVVNWPGDLTRDPKGWTMPSDAKRLRIGVPGATGFQKFLKVETVEDNLEYSGFCIDVFYEVRNILEKSYPMPYDFTPFHGSYDELVMNLTELGNEVILSLFQYSSKDGILQ